MLAKSRSDKRSAQVPDNTEIQFYVKKLNLSDYETYHYDKEKLRDIYDSQQILSTQDQSDTNQNSPSHNTLNVANYNLSCNTILPSKPISEISIPESKISTTPIPSQQTYPLHEYEDELELDEDVNLVNYQTINISPTSTLLRQHHNQQFSPAILANRKIECLSSRNENVLFKAASTGDTATLAQLHLNGCSLLSLDNQGATVLHHAVYNGHLDMIQYLLRQGCAPALIKNGGPSYKYKHSALHLAAKRGYQTICSVLLAAGADPTILDQNGNTPAQVALGAGHDHVFADLNRKFK
ncbi:hypothetical protein RND71_043720 [Anisodus tanguticus]|uniref:Uncharacterized protein n=1 Tax=Anisodus tanguticus TaxID=243964 RepID=A0AAE1QP95_9SOLA|nr:hypothetical protein RND71_043720 [Anisodus tanguticus]